MRDIEPRREQEQAEAETSLRIGSIVGCFSFNRAEDCRDFQALYRAFLTGEPADINVSLETARRFDPTTLDRVMEETTYTHENNRFRTSSQVASGEYDLGRGWISMAVERELGELTHESNYLNKLMRLVYYSACRVKYGDAPMPAMLIEGCSILSHGKGILLTGLAMEARTMLAGMFREGNTVVINDENILLSRNENGAASLENAPIINSVPLKQSSPVPAAGIFLLKQGEGNSARKLEAAEAWVKLIRQIPNPAHIGQTSKREIYGVMADFSAAIVERVPVHELEFTPDPEGWLNITTNIDSIVLEKEMVI